MKKHSIIFIVAGLVALLCVVLVIFVFADQKAQSIPMGSSLKQARELSSGKKQQCLSDNAQAVAGVKKDDVITDDFSRFELAASEGIMDVPAGTNYETTVSSYDGKIVHGTVAYEKDYGTYNYTIKKLDKAGEWQFVSMIACAK